MGNWTLQIKGHGIHHNAGHIDDANRRLAVFVQELIDAGHDISHASITVGNEEIVHDGAHPVSAYVADQIAQKKARDASGR